MVEEEGGEGERRSSRDTNAGVRAREEVSLTRKGGAGNFVERFVYKKMKK